MTRDFSLALTLLRDIQSQSKYVVEPDGNTTTCFHAAWRIRVWCKADEVLLIEQMKFF